MKTAIVAFSNQKDNIEKIKTYITAAVQIPSDHIELWLIGDCEEISDYKILPLEKIYWIKSLPISSVGQQFAAEDILPVLEQLNESNRPDTLIFCQGISGNEFAIRLGYRTGGSCITDASNIEWIDHHFYATRGVYSFNLKAKFEMKQNPYLITLAIGTYDPISTIGSPELAIVDISANTNHPWSINIQVEDKKEIEDLENAKIIIAGGRGVGSKSAMESLGELADKINGKLGGTRPTVLDSWLKMNQMLGSSGNVTKPKLCITFGASGSGPFIVGIEKSECIVSVNNDPKALIFRESNVGIVEDCNEIADELKKLLEQER